MASKCRVYKKQEDETIASMVVPVDQIPDGWVTDLDKPVEKPKQPVFKKAVAKKAPAKKKAK